MSGRRRRFNPIRLFRRAKRLAFLTSSNAFSNAKATGDADVIVSLTSHGKRIARLHHALETIAIGRVRPRHILVWLSADLKNEPLTGPLSRLRRRGVEFGYAPDVGPHKKYYYALDRAIEAGCSLVTADDDIYYPRNWLHDLFEAHSQTPDHIVSNRARRLSFEPDGEIAPYSAWPFMSNGEPDPLAFLTGVSGVIYPVAFLQILRQAGDAFRETVPKRTMFGSTTTPPKRVFRFGRRATSLSASRTCRERKKPRSGVRTWMAETTGRSSEPMIRRH